MSLILPDFKGRKCLELACCGFLPPEKAGKPREDVQAKKTSMTARYTKSGREIYMRLFLPFPWEKSPGGRIHVHLVLAPKEWFTKKPPKVNCKPEDIFAVISPFVAEKIDVHLTGKFRVPTAELPSFIRSTSVETVVNGIQVRLTGGTLSVDGLPIRSITWELARGSDLRPSRLMREPAWSWMSHILRGALIFSSQPSRRSFSGRNAMSENLYESDIIQEDNTHRGLSRWDDDEEIECGFTPYTEWSPASEDWASLHKAFCNLLEAWEERR